MPTSSIIIVAVVFIAGLLSGALFIFWRLRGRKPDDQPEASPLSVQPAPPAKGDALVFRLSYVITPVLLCAASLVTAASFASYVPSRLAFRFNSNGAPVSYMSKYAFLIIMMATQILCAAVAWGIAEVVIRLGKSAFLTSAPQFKLDGMVSLMCNMILLPQLILACIMLDALIYGAQARHLFSIGIFSILVLAIGSLVIITAFIRVLSKARNAMNKQ
jgi:uncharacterized membrane protein